MPHYSVNISTEPNLRLLLTCLLTAAAAKAGVVQGSVLEYGSGLPLARTMVFLQPVPTTDGRTLRSFRIRTESSGHFQFSNVPDGLYLIVATREGFLPASHGQRRASGHGMPFEVTRESDFYTDLRMHRMGAITGRVLDENGVGIPRVPVVAYRARLPLRLAGRGVSDDRGVFRVSGLASGKYWVRSAPASLEDGAGLLPMFAQESAEPRDARVYEAHTDEETGYADIRPQFGRLLSLSGFIDCPREAGNATLVVSSETGRHQLQTACPGAFSVTGLAPGRYEVFAATQDSSLSGFQEVPVYSPETGMGTLTLGQTPRVIFDIEGPGATRDMPLRLTGRRRDFSESGSETAIPVPVARLAAGHWEIAGSAGRGYYIASMYGRYPVRREAAPLEGVDVDRHEVIIGNGVAERVRVTVSDEAAQLDGIVRDVGKPVPGVPVFLWPDSEDARRSLSGAPETLTKTDGRFAFEGLPPGSYRIFASFDYSEVEGDSFDEARADRITVKAKDSKSVNLQLWIAP